MLSLSQIAVILKENDFFHILTHIYPDGDTLGSAFALCRILQKLGKHAKVLYDNSIPEKFAYLSDFVEEQEFSPKYIVAVDLADTALLGPNLQKYSRMIDLCIDHHLSNKNYAKAVYVDSKAAANCEIIYRLILEMSADIDKETATAIYTGIATDTGCFEYSNTTADSHLIAADLINYGAPVGIINEKLFTLKTFKKIETEKNMYKNLKYFFDGKCAITFITLEEMDIIGITDNELDGIASIPIKIEGVEIGITIREKSSGVHKVSVRTSNNINANEFCRIFDGGGHAKSGGFCISGTIRDSKNHIIEELKFYSGW